MGASKQMVAVAPRIVKALLVSPRLSIQVCGAAPSPFGNQVLGWARDIGVTVFLTAVAQKDIQSLRTWYEGLNEPDLKANVRVLSPGRLLWPGGALRMPFETKRPEDAAGMARALVEKTLDGAGVAAQVLFDPVEGHLAIIGPQRLPPDLVVAIWEAANTAEVTLGFDPDAPLEAHAVEDGGWITVLGVRSRNVV